MKYLDTKQILRIFWHPHQKLWNYVLVKEVEKIFPIPCINYRLIQIIIVLDTFIFFYGFSLEDSIRLESKIFSLRKVYLKILLYYISI